MDSTDKNISVHRLVLATAFAGIIAVIGWLLVSGKGATVDKTQSLLQNLTNSGITLANSEQCQYALTDQAEGIYFVGCGGFF
jgi:hypothetical protein